MLGAQAFLSTAPTPIRVAQKEQHRGRESAQLLHVHTHSSWPAGGPGLARHDRHDARTSWHHQGRQALCVCTALSPVSVPVPAPSGWDAGSSALRPLPRDVEGVADDPSLHNPLQRMHRLGPGWMGVILEYEGVLVEDTSMLHSKAWEQVGQEEELPRPLHHALKRAEGMKSEQVIQEVFCWTRAPMEVRRLAARKEELYRELLGGRTPMVPEGLQRLMDLLNAHAVPVAVACSAPEARVRPVLEATGLAAQLEATVTAEDVYRGRPDPEGYLYAAQQLQRPPMRCVVIGNSNQSVEAARECGMACVAVAGRTPLYELTAADLVVRQLDELSFINLKQLFCQEHHVEPQPLEQMEEDAEQAIEPISTLPW